jgi:hypothetical protein
MVKGFFIGVLVVGGLQGMNTLIFTLALSNALLVFFGAGAKGWANVVREQTPDPEVTKLLSDRYVCVFVDTGSATGKKLAQNFDISGNVGMVISDRTGSPTDGCPFRGSFPGTPP